MLKRCLFLFGVVLCGGLLLSQPAFARDIRETVRTHISEGAQVIEWIEVRVNNDIITRGQLDEMIQRVALETGVEPTEELGTRVRREMIDDLLILQLANKESINIPNSEINAYIDQLVAGKMARSGMESEEQLWSELQAAGLSKEIYRKDLSEEYCKRAKISQMKMRLAQDIVVTQEEIEKYRKENPEKSRSMEKIQISMIHLDTPPDATEEQKQSLMLKAQTLKTRLDASVSAAGSIKYAIGEFAKAAQKYSDHSSAKKGGDMGIINRGDVPKLDYLFDNKVGFITDPEYTSSAIRIYQLTGKVTLDQSLRKQKFESEYNKVLDELKSDSIIEIRGQRVSF
jgi:PPIC-type PPIASE domain